MAKIEGEITIGRLREAVFDFVADQRNEPLYIWGSMKRYPETPKPRPPHRTPGTED